MRSEIRHSRSSVRSYVRCVCFIPQGRLRPSLRRSLAGGYRALSAVRWSKHKASLTAASCSGGAMMARDTAEKQKQNKKKKQEEPKAEQQVEDTNGTVAGGTDTGSTGSGECLLVDPPSVIPASCAPSTSSTLPRAFHTGSVLPLSKRQRYLYNHVIF